MYVYTLTGFLAAIVYATPNALFHNNWMPVSAPWNVKILAACVTLIGLVRGDLYCISDISLGINLDGVMKSCEKQ